jgi:MraZ protein
MLLTGTFPRTLDDKNRLALPRRLREQMGMPGLLYLTPGAEQTLWVYTPDCLQRVAEKLEQSPGRSEDARVYGRLFFAQSEAANVDRAGRLLVPEKLAAFAGLKHEVVLLGVRDHLELWDAVRWQEYLSRNAPRFDVVAASAFGATIATTQATGGAAPPVG